MAVQKLNTRQEFPELERKNEISMNRVIAVLRVMNIDFVLN